MNKLIPTIIILVLVGLGFWYWQNTSNQDSSVSNSDQSASSVDCGTDTACFAKNFRSCTPSKIYKGTTEIKSGTVSSCVVVFLSTDDPKYTGGERLTMNCTVKNTNTFKDEEINGFAVYQKGSVCSGLLYDAYLKISPR